MKQALAIAHNVRKHAKKMSKGGAVNEDLSPETSNPSATKTEDLDHLHLGEFAQNHEDIDEPAEPMKEVHPQDDAMGRSESGERIRRALHMSRGGSVDERHIKQPGEDRRLAMNDTYPTNPYEESDTQAQDSDYGDAPMRNTYGDEDQQANRAATARSPMRMAEGGMIRDLNEAPRHDQSMSMPNNEEGMVDQDEARMGRLARILNSVRNDNMGKYSNSNTPVPSGTQRMSNRPHAGKMRKQP